MEDFSKYHAVIQDRIHDPGANYYEPFWWDREIEVFISNISTSVQFIESECTDEEFYWLSEVFEEIAERTQSKELISTLRARLASVTPENYRQNEFKSKHMRDWVDYAEYVQSISMEIDFAEGRIEDWEE